MSDPLPRNIPIGGGIYLPALSLPAGEEDTQLCPVGSFSADPLIPGVCNQTILLGGALLFVLFWIFGRRG